MIPEQQIPQPLTAAEWAGLAALSAAAQPYVAELKATPGPMSATLRQVLAVVEGLEYRGVTVESVDIPFVDEPAISLAEGTQLDDADVCRNEGHHIGQIEETYTLCSMERQGIHIDWYVREVAHGL